MMLNLLVLLVIAIIWVAALWLTIAPYFSAWSDIGIVSVHIFPVLSAWMIWYFLRRRLQIQRANEARAREEAAQAERKEAREAAQVKYEEEMRHRRFGCDCRIVAISRLGLTAPLAIAEIAHPNIDIRSMSLESVDEGGSGSILDRLVPAVVDTLTSIYATCSASTAFPIFVLPPSEVAGEEVIVRLRAVQGELAGEHAPWLNRGGDRPPILFLPASDCASNSIVTLFETTPDLPGAIILAFDSPLSHTSRGRDEFEDEPSPTQLAREQFAGKPSEAVVAMLMTNAELPMMLAAIANTTSETNQDSMTPYWERALQTGGQLEMLARADAELRAELLGSPVLGRVHRAALRQGSATRSGVLEMTRRLQDALEQAQINAGLIETPFSFDGEQAPACDPQPSELESVRCGAIVHNAGSVDVAGKRLAALGSALYYFNIDLNPVDHEVAVNVVTRVGDIGRATGIGQLALSIAYTATQGTPALCAEFLGGEHIATAFVMPAQIATMEQSLRAAA